MRAAAPAEDYRRWVEHALTALGPATPAAVTQCIRANDGENLFEKNVRWARFQLSQEGVITSPKRGVWALT